MAEAALFTIASKVLSTIATPAFEKAYERARSIYGASDELKELKETITSIQAVLLDAEKQHTDSATVKNWVGRVRDVLYDAEDLFDVVATNVLLKQQMKGKKPLKEVKVFLSKLNPIASSDFIAKKVKAIRKDLRRITDDMALLGFVKCESEKPISGMRRGAETGSFVGQDEVIGRDEEKEEVVNFVYDEDYVDRNISLVSVVGIGGMGKSTLAQLVYNDAKICGGFQRRYWACISDIFDEKEVLGKIYQSMTGQRQYQGLSLNHLQSSIRESVDRNGRFLLVLDDLWDEDAGRGDKLWSILSSEKAKGSKIIITTRHLSVAKAMRADKTLVLEGLSRDASWALFKRYAFTEEQENDPAWISIGEKILSKCVNVPLAIKSIACLLRVKDTIGEWKSLENERLFEIESSDNPIMSALRLSYDHLPSHLKNCFAYCSLYPKDSKLNKQNLIYLWIAQGYIKPKKDETLEMAGHTCFMELFRRSFFEEAKNDYDGEENKHCMMHDLVHDLAQDVAGEECCIITTQGMNQPRNKIRHANVLLHEIDCKSSNIPLSLLEVDRLRSSLFTHAFSNCSGVLDGWVTKFRFLRALHFKFQLIESVPSSIGEMKHLRYLNLSGNNFTHLPDSITKLVNLITLDISWCNNLVELPRKIRGLISLRHLINYQCRKLVHMPPTLGELTFLEHLNEFKVSKSGDGESCGLDALARMNLRGSLRIEYGRSINRCEGVVFLGCGQIPDTLETLLICRYPSMRLPVWWRVDINPASRLPKLDSLTIEDSVIRNLAPLRCLPLLRFLRLYNLPNLEYIEEEDVVVSTTSFFPSLHELSIVALEDLKGWSRPKNSVELEEVNHPLMFPFLSTLCIDQCRDLVSWPPLAPRLKTLRLNLVREELLQQFVSKPYTDLVNIIISSCLNLTSFPGEGLASLRVLEISYCSDLKKVRVASPSVIEEFSLSHCPKMVLWEEESVDWASFSNLRLLRLDRIPEESKLPDCLQQLISLDKLRISDEFCK